MEETKNLIDHLLLFLNKADNEVVHEISRFYSRSYFYHVSLPGLASKIPEITRLLIYNTIALTAIIPLKLFFPDSRLRSIITYGLFIIFNLLIVAIFFGLFQLLFTF